MRRKRYWVDSVRESHMKPYKTVDQSSEASFEIQKSTFIGYAKRVQTEEEAQEFLTSIKKEHPQARHHCSAWILSDQCKRFDDDKEPQGTAGLPILRVLEGQGLTKTAVVVVRYFGGVLLGTGGLTRAYGRAASLAVDEARICMRVPLQSLFVEIDYTLWGQVEHELKSKNKEIVNLTFLDKVHCTFLTEEECIKDWEAYFASISQGKIQVIQKEIVWRTQPIEGEENE